MIDRHDAAAQDRVQALSEQERVARAPERDPSVAVSMAGAVALHALGGLSARESPVELADRAHHELSQIVDGRAWMAAVSSARMRAVSCSSSRVACTRSLLASTTCSGSMKSVWPLCERSWTMPRTRGPRLGPHRQDVAAVSKRDVPVGEEPVGVVALEGALELDAELSAPLADLTAEALERGAGVIRHGAARVEGAAEPVGELGEAGQGVGDRRHARTGLAHAAAVGAELGARVEDGDDLDHLEAVEHAALSATARQDRSDVGEGLQGSEPAVASARRASRVIAIAA